jgi:hypothetical protein
MMADPITAAVAKPAWNELLPDSLLGGGATLIVVVKPIDANCSALATLTQLPLSSLLFRGFQPSAHCPQSAPLYPVPSKFMINSSVASMHIKKENGHWHKNKCD